MAAATAAVVAAVSMPAVSRAGVGQGFGGCAGSGGGDTSAIAAQLACGLPPPSGNGNQNTGSGNYGATSGPTIGAPCLATQVETLPDPDVGSRERFYVAVLPHLTSSPGGGLATAATITSPLPINSPAGPRTLVVPSSSVQTAAQIDAEEQSQAAALAAVYNAQVQQQITLAEQYQSALYLQHLLAQSPYTAADFYLPPTPPVPGAMATAEDAATWTIQERVYLHPGIVTRDQVGISALHLPLYGPPYCAGLAITGVATPTLDTLAHTTLAAFHAQIQQVADSLWASFRRGSVVTLPPAGHPLYVGAPTCVGLDTGLPAGSSTPNPFSITLPLSLTGIAAQLPVTVAGRLAVSIAAQGVHWDFHDPSGDTTVHGQDSPDDPPPSTPPTFDPTTDSWPNANSVCAVSHQYAGLAPAPGVDITASEHFLITVSGAYSTGTDIPTTFTYTYEPPDSPVTWTAGPFPIYQIEAVPYDPTPSP
ncbi:MAG: hypothetical protein ACYDAC_12390 [Candidatus Dormibacteria bacterium]